MGRDHSIVCDRCGSSYGGFNGPDECDCVATSKPEPCQCNSPLCEASWICKTLGEYRIAWRVAERARDTLGGLGTIKDLMDHLEIECEILRK